MEQQDFNGDAATTFLQANLSTPLQPVSLLEVGNSNIHSLIYKMLFNYIWRMYYYVIIALQTGLENDFSQIKIDVVTCPALTREPFNLAGVGKKFYEHYYFY